jgi:ribosomal protein S17E
MQLSRLASFGLVVASFWVFLGSVPAQDQLITKEQEEQFRQISFQFETRVLKGDDTATGPQLELAARYYVLRVTFAQAQTDVNVMARIMTEYNAMLAYATGPANSKTNRDITINKFAPELVKSFKQIFDLDFNDNRMAVINAAVMLPQFAKLKHDDIGDFLASIVADEKKHDAVRVHAAWALHEFFPARAFTKLDLNQSDTKQLLARKNREKQRIDALLKIIDRPMPAIADPYEIDALRYVRRKAVESLAMTRVPAVSAYDPKNKVEGPVALGLVKVLAKKIQPEPALLERVEAAIGVCEFTKDVTEYDPKIGIYLVGETLGDLVSEYKRDYNNISAKAKERKPTTMYWKETPKRLEAALTVLVNNSRGTPNAAGVQSLDAATRPILKNIYNSDPIDREQQFRDVVQKLRPNTKVLFKNGKDALLEFDWTPAAPVEEKQVNEK